MSQRGNDILLGGVGVGAWGGGGRGEQGGGGGGGVIGVKIVFVSF